MYLPRAFEETRAEVLHALMRAYPFATLIAVQDGVPLANHLPLEWVSEGMCLQGHVARGNALATLDGAPVLVIFQGPQGYVSPNWYPRKHETGREVPTWNYAVVHARGRLRVIEDAPWLRSLLVRLTDRHEAGEPMPWRLSDAPEDHIALLLRGVVGIEIAVDQLQGKFKLSQNHPVGNRAGVIAGLRRRAQGDDEALAALMLAFEESRNDA
ncbi:MAG: FMN-binding negative transcriptional regulator [Fulvimonas sp.]|nr:FMN-binding negative transcriptional regulator [Fulvimonas sp.]